MERSKLARQRGSGGVGMKVFCFSARVIVRAKSYLVFVVIENVIRYTICDELVAKQGLPQQRQSGRLINGRTVKCQHEAVK